MTAVGYMVLNREDPRLAWDGELHQTAELAFAQLRDAESNPAEYGSGWYVAECREMAHQPALFETVSP